MYCMRWFDVILFLCEHIDDPWWKLACSTINNKLAGNSAVLITSMHIYILYQLDDAWCIYIQIVASSLCYCASTTRKRALGTGWERPKAPVSQPVPRNRDHWPLLKTPGFSTGALGFHWYLCLVVWYEYIGFVTLPSQRIIHVFARFLVTFVDQFLVD